MGYWWLLYIILMILYIRKYFNEILYVINNFINKKVLLVVEKIVVDGGL